MMHRNASNKEMTMTSSDRKDVLALHMMAMISALAETDGPVSEGVMYHYLFQNGYDVAEANAVITGMVELGLQYATALQGTLPPKRHSRLGRCFERPAVVQ